MLSKAELKDSKILICGIQGSGKTYLAKYIAKHFKTFVYTPHLDEWEDENVYLYQYENFYKDFEAISEKVKEWSIKGKIDLFIIDEFDMLFKSNYDINRGFNDLIINHRHYNLTLLGITRRPQDIPTKYFESSHYLFIFTLEAPNAIKKLNEIYPNLGSMAKSLPYKSYKFIFKKIGEKPKIMKI